MIKKCFAIILAFCFFFSTALSASSPQFPPIELWDQLNFVPTQEILDYLGIVPEEDPYEVRLIVPTDQVNDSFVTFSPTAYIRYIQEHGHYPSPLRSISIPGSTAQVSDSEVIQPSTQFEGRPNVLHWTGQDGEATWIVNVPEAGLYTIEVFYWMLDERGRDFEFELTINGERPFDEAGHLLLRHRWRDTHAITQDRRSNDLRPPQIPAFMWKSQTLNDTEGMTDGAFNFFFEAGQHEISFRALRGEIAISEIVLFNAPPLLTYVEFRAANAHLPVVPNIFITYEAEEALYKSDAMLFPTYDRSSALTTPYHHANIRLNTIGGPNWQFPGQYIQWVVTVPEDGLYQITFRARQNVALGMQSRRSLSVNGEIQFAEAAELVIPYNHNWVNFTPSDANGEPFLFALNAGENILSLEVVMGSAARTMSAIREILFMLNADYRRILAITGPNPDMLQEYRLDQQIPSLLPNFEYAAAALRAEIALIEAEGGDSGGETSIMERLATTLDMSVRDPDSIPRRLSDLEGAISALATYMLVLRSQPLELDKFYIHSPDAEIPRATDGFWRALWHQIRIFIASFFIDFSVVDQAEEGARAITVWYFGGRDHAQIIHMMATDTFTEQTGIQISMQLVQTDLITAIVSGNAPDVLINAERSMPVELAMRGAVQDLSVLPGFDEVRERFMPDAMLPYTFRGGVYAIPMTQMFHMMFYRTDIFTELGIEPPDTWDEFYEIIPVLHRRNMQVGLPLDQMRAPTMGEAVMVARAGLGIRNLFTTLLYQRGQDLFLPDGTMTTFDQDESVEAFVQWTQFYTHHGLPDFFDFYNRFRTGMMPIGVQPWWWYNMLMVAAPEIRGMWEMVPIPGTVQPDGSINRSSGTTGEGSIILNHTDDLDASWQFVKWWTSAETQARFGMELEMLMGPAARYNTANLEAFSMLPWSLQEQELLMYQWRWVREVPVIPGGYYVARNLDNAFRRVVIFDENPRDVLLRFNRNINAEIARRLLEFPAD
ncbi:MAG: extracellular solute-binding protein [Defluviitaleaceae bacterium]|nr:extracellular solute-binding protein [Defluviitaleaceae bacterium]